MARYRFGSAFGIPPNVDITFLLVLPLFAWLIGNQVGRVRGCPQRHTRGIHPAGAVCGHADLLRAGTGGVLHELGHSLVAMQLGCPIASVTL